MQDKKKPQAEKPREQNVIKWLLGFQETESERKAREAREERDKRTRAAVQKAIKGAGVLKDTVDKAKKSNEARKKKESGGF